MFQGYLMFDGYEVVNTHRAQAYAATAGLPWVQGCSECSSILAAAEGPYISPLRDVVKPPWWNGTKDSEDFLGVVGVSISNADDSMRDMEVTDGANDGGYIGGLRYTFRTIVVRAILIATTDCALGYGIGWLRFQDTENKCGTGQVGMYECCPHMSQADCNDPACVQQCTDDRWRIFYEARFTSGPTVLRRREMSSRGWMAEVEFTITCGDPFRYGLPVVAADAVTPDSVAVTEPTARAEELVDAFAVGTPYPTPPSLTRRSLEPREQWIRQTIEAPALGHFSTVVPVVTVAADDGPVEDVRVSLVSGGEVVAAFRLVSLPAGGVVTVDYRAKTVTTESNGNARLNNAYARSADGSLMRWPKRFPAGEYEVWVDRASGPPVTASVALMGRVSA